VAAQRLDQVARGSAPAQVEGGVDEVVGPLVGGVAGAGGLVVVVGGGGSVVGEPGTVVGGFWKKSIAGLSSVVVVATGSAGRLLAQAPRPSAAATAAATSCGTRRQVRAPGPRTDLTMTRGS